MTPDNKTMNETEIQDIVEIPYSGKKNVILDATILSSLMNCPRMADLRFNHSFVSIGGKSNSLECGSLVHTFFEYYYRNLIAGVKKDEAIGFGYAAAEMYIRGCKGCMDFKPIHSITDETTSANQSEHVCNKLCILKPPCGHKPEEFPGMTNTPKDSEGYKTGWQWVLDSIDQYLNHYRNDHWVPLEVEVVKSKVLYEDDEVRVLWKAKLDLTVDTNQGIYPVDHKTMKQTRPNNTLSNQFMGQALIMGTRNVFINKFGFQKSLKPEEKFKREAISFSAARLMEWQSETLPYYAKLLLMYAESGHFPPNYSNCDGKFGNCVFIRVCESDPGMREEELKLNFKVGPEWNPTNDLDTE